MTQPDLWTLVGRSVVDRDFATTLTATSVQQAASDAEYQLDDQEAAYANRILPTLIGFAHGSQPDQELIRRQFKAQADRAIELGQYTVDILKTTLANASRTYRSISQMNRIMFALGILLLLTAVVYGIVTGDAWQSLIFGGLGIVSFVGMFLVGPIEKSQAALSNLVQVEASFMNYFEQITFWETFGLTPDPTTGFPNPEKLERASANLQKRTAETMALLQRYIEPEAQAET